MNHAIENAGLSHVEDSQHDLYIKRHCQPLAPPPRTTTTTRSTSSTTTTTTTTSTTTTSTSMDWVDPCSGHGAQFGRGCECDEGWTGIICEQLALDPCEQRDCGNGSVLTCTKQFNNFYSATAMVTAIAIAIGMRFTVSKCKRALTRQSSQHYRHEQRRPDRPRARRRA